MRSAKVTYRLVIFIIALVLGIGFSAPSFFKDMGGAKISLGLDLQGGLHMLLGVETEEAIHSKVKSIASSINYYAGKEDILIDNFKIRQDYVNFELLDSDDQRKIDDMLKEIKGLDVTKEALKYTIRLSDSEKAETIEYAINQAVETIRNRLDQFGLAEPTVARQGEEKILVELPGVKTQADEQRARELIAKAAHLQLMALDEKRQPQANTLSAAEAESYGSIVYPDVKNEQQKYVVKNIPVLDGSMLTDARVAFDQRTNAPVISFTLNAEGARIFGDFTGANVGKRLAIVLDGKVYSAPVINERIGGGNGQISGGFSVEEAHDVAIALRSGALLAPVKMLEKRSIGPSLGADSINQSMTALASAGVLVVLFMIVYYGFAGILANFALIANILILVAVMAMFGATLTLPGMAGVVLTIGMAVDANVIINERIREFLRDGHGIAASVKKGYENAMSAIIDANLTTLITSAVLYAYGTGPVKGFAVTMSIGILASMLTAILGTRGMFDALMDRIEKSGNTQIWFGYKRG
ncbi:protein translocase subunit SecD [Campylobacter sp. CCUG 57310]|uniref:protein translocase subunit SecD n=1 Tax=Campylobacter sp. CCUG 57310 TaxID=2517362 RepID=UPI001564F3D8|nr:protein translocase subunit SecD [Campylobacter sp. CCUG 57310]QKF91929.1 protein-export membrane protein SecD [Campylobacter sp. CCUG 57310]